MTLNPREAQITTPATIIGLIQDRQGLCQPAQLWQDGPLLRDGGGGIYEPDGSQRVVGWYGMEGEWKRLRCSNGFTFLVKPTT